MSTLRIEPDGTVLALYSDELEPLLKVLLTQGKGTITRASHVEPNSAGGWTADLSPVDGPMLGPFPTRAAALAAETAWIEKHLEE